MALRGRMNKADQKVQVQVKDMYTNLNKIYSNKSSDEFKMSGDISKSPVYDRLQRMIADLSTLKGFNRGEADELKKMFNVLHRPIFRTEVTNYIHKKDDEDAIAVILFTIGYRVLVGELGRIYASTEATESGFAYKPDKISKKDSMDKFIRVFNTKIDQELNKFVRRTTKPVVGVKQEAFVGSAAAVAGAIAGIMDRITPFFEEIGAWMDLLHIGDIVNPVAFINRMLGNHYQRKVDKFNDVSDMYLATKEAYDEYMKLPASQRKKKVESKYIKNMQKYNIKMQNRAAKIAHYDQRSIKETREEAMREGNKFTSGDSDSTPTKSEPTSSTSSGDGDNFDF